MADVQRYDKHTLVSIIIPCREIDDNAKRCISHCFNLKNKIEIMPVPDMVCPGLPATKRNFAMYYAKGDILAFIDSDAYPSVDWLDKALPHLNEFSAVCGPGILPIGATFFQYIVDLIYRCFPYSYRVVPKHKRIVKEFPTFNLIVRKDKALKFKSYLTGEDSLFCRELDGHILYDPQVLVYHSRRPLFKPYWKQVSTYGWHRGYLVGLAFYGWFSTFFIYGGNFLCGFFTCLMNTRNRGKEKK